MKNLSFEQMEVISGGQTVTAVAGPVMPEDGIRVSCFWAFPILAVSYINLTVGTLAQPFTTNFIVKCATT